MQQLCIFFISEFTKIIATTGWDGFYSLSSTEIIDLNGTCSVSLPDYPMKLDGATGLYVDGKIVICGGGFPNANRKCYQLKKGGKTFELVFTMESAVRYAKSIVHQGYMIRSGGYYNGYYNGDVNISGTAEFINHQISNNTVPKPQILLPEPVSQHAIVNINQFNSFLIGGITGSESNKEAYSSRTYFYKNMKWKAGPKLNIGRKDLTAGVLTDHETNKQHIAVVGGTNGIMLNSVEILFQGLHFWNKGMFVHYLNNFQQK